MRMKLEKIKNEMNGLKYNICKEDCINDYNCENCSGIKNCYYKAASIEDSLYAENLDYGGYDSEEEFWEQTISC